jgi:hypothetical protein
MVALFLLALLIVLGAAVLLGCTPDTRDPEFSLGKVLEPHAASDEKSR